MKVIKDKAENYDELKIAIAAGHTVQICSINQHGQSVVWASVTEVNENFPANRYRILDIQNIPSGTEADVCNDITDRQRVGIAKYGMTVRENPLDPRAWAKHAYTEALDFAVYLKRFLEANDIQDDVRDFMRKAGQPCPESPTFPDRETRLLRIKLIAEELLELCSAFDMYLEIRDGEIRIFDLVPGSINHGDRIGHLTEAYDAIIDLLVVTLGVGVTMGMNVAPGWKEVHRSNMTKFIDGHRREDGKWVKGPSYSPANLRPIIEVQTQIEEEY